MEESRSEKTQSCLSSEQIQEIIGYYQEEIQKSIDYLSHLMDLFEGYFLSSSKKVTEMEIQNMRSEMEKVKKEIKEKQRLFKEKIEEVANKARCDI